MKTVAFVLVWPIAAALAVPRGALAQASESRDAHLRNDCRLASQVLTTGHPAPRREWALEVISRCENSGPVVLANLWRDAPATITALQELQGPSNRISDNRLYTTLTTIARDRGVADLKRVVALQVLASYAAPNEGMSLGELLDPRPDAERTVTTYGVDYRPHHSGSEPLPGTVPEDVARLMRELAAGESTSVVGRAAQRLSHFVLGAG